METCNKKRACLRALSDKSLFALCHLCRCVSHWLGSRTPDVRGEDRAGLLAVTPGDDDSDWLVRIGDFTNLLHNILTVIELADVTSAAHKGTLDASGAQIPKSLIFHDLCYTEDAC